MSTFFVVIFFFFNDTATTEIYTLSLHDALPICQGRHDQGVLVGGKGPLAPTGPIRARAEAEVVIRLGLGAGVGVAKRWQAGQRSEEHTSELQSRQYLVCRLLLEKKKKN